jgi:hypothetical protein
VGFFLRVFLTGYLHRPGSQADAVCGWAIMAKAVTNLTLTKPKKKRRTCVTPPQNVTVAYLTYNVREEAMFTNAFDAVNAGDVSSFAHLLLCPLTPTCERAHTRHLKTMCALSPFVLDVLAAHTACWTALCGPGHTAEHDHAVLRQISHDWR